MNAMHLTVIARNDNPEPERPHDELMVRRLRRRMRLESPYFWHRSPNRTPDGCA